MNSASAAQLALIVGAVLLSVDLTLTFSGHSGGATRALGVIAPFFVLGGIVLRAKSRKIVE